MGSCLGDIAVRMPDRGLVFERVTCFYCSIDRQPPIALNELTNKRTKTSEQKSRRKRSHVKQTRDSHVRENPAKRARHTMNSEEAIKKRIKNSEEAILKLETHRQKQTCPKT